MTKAESKKIFAQNLRYYMQLYEKDRNQICQELNVKYPTFSDWYNAKKYPRIDKIEKLANYFHIKKSDLIESHLTTEQKNNNEPSIAKLQQTRIENNITLEQLSDAIHIPKETLEQYEEGKAVPSTKTLVKLCEYFTISADYLLGISDISQNQSTISHSTVVSNNHLSHINIKSEQELTTQAKELVNIYENLDLRKQTKLLSYAFELENEN